MNIKDVYNTYKGCIFERFTDKPWGTKYKDETLDLLYWTHSNKKSVSPVITDVMAGDTLSDEEKTQLAEMLEVMFMDNWKYLYKALLADYNPIYNYGMEEHETIGVTGESNGTNSNTKTVNDKLVIDRDVKGNSEISNTTKGDTTETTEATTTQTDKGTSETTTTQSETGKANSNVHSNVYAYDSETAVNDSDQTTTSDTENSLNSTVNGNTNNTTDITTNTTGNGTSNETTNGTTADTTSEDTTQTNTGTETNSGTDSETNKQDTTRDLTREGNIGVTTSQQMIDSEIKLRETKYWDLVFRDIDSLLCLSIWD